MAVQGSVPVLGEVCEAQQTHHGQCKMIPNSACGFAMLGVFTYGQVNPPARRALPVRVCGCTPGCPQPSGVSRAPAQAGSALLPSPIGRAILRRRNEECRALEAPGLPEQQRGHGSGGAWRVPAGFGAPEWEKAGMCRGRGAVGGQGGTGIVTQAGAVPARGHPWLSLSLSQPSPGGSVCPHRGWSCDGFNAHAEVGVSAGLSRSWPGTEPVSSSVPSA